MSITTQDDRLQAALEHIEALQQRQIEIRSKQSRFTQPTSLFTSAYNWTREAASQIPHYQADSRRRDAFLRSFWRSEPHLAGVINSVVSIDKNRGWNMTGGRNQVLRYESILRDAEDGQGWRYFMSQASLAYYTADMGAVVELGRDASAGPLRALYNVDPVACRLTGDPTKPLAYYDSAATRTRGYPDLYRGGDGQQWQPQDFLRCVPLPNNDQNFHGLGYCAVSRVLELAQIMCAVYQHDQELLGSRAPKGLLLLNNITQDQWNQAMTARDAQLNAKERQYYGAVEVIAQLGSEPPDAKLFALSQLPAGFDIKVMTDLLMFAYALCFGYDPIEFWPVMSGALGRGRETDIQHRKGTGKGGMEFIFTMQDRVQQELPDTLLFQFEERDAEGELLDAQIHKAWADVAAVLFDKGAGILTQAQAASYLADKGVIPAEWTENLEESTVDDEGVERSLKRLRDQALEYDTVQRAIWQFPRDPIVQRAFNPRTNQVKEVLLWETGDEAQRRRAWPAPDLGKPGAIHRPRVQRDTLFKGMEVVITDEDVDRAIQEGKERVGSRFAALLEAEPMEDQ